MIIGKNAGRRKTVERSVKAKRPKVPAVTIKTAEAHTDYLVTPQELTGVYQYDFCNTADLFTQNLTKPGDGTSTVVLTFVNINDGGKPIINSRVKVWGCEEDGDTIAAGLQMTDCNGEVTFRINSSSLLKDAFHFEFYLNGMLKAASKLSIPDVGRVKSDIADGYCTMVIGVDVPAKGIIALTPETGGQFILEQNYPNPIADKTTIGFALLQESKVSLEIYDTNGRKIECLIDEFMEAGYHTAQWERNVLPGGNYLYQLSVENKDGIYRQIKIMTVE